MNKLSHQLLPSAIFIMGPTACGKTALAAALSRCLPVELISVDSALIYREMDIGTAKPTAEELACFPHRLIDIRDPTEHYSVASFYEDALHEMTQITKSGRIPLLVGGTMLYFKALLSGLSPLPCSDPVVRSDIEQQAVKQGWESLHQRLAGIDPVSAMRIHPNDSQRISRALEVFFISGRTLTELYQAESKTIPYKIHQFAVMPACRELLHQDIASRFHEMLKKGFETEVQALFDRGDLHANLPSIRSVGYRQMWSYLSGEIHYHEMVDRSIYATRQLAKRQITWLRGWDTLHWLESHNIQKTLKRIVEVVSI